MSTQSNVQQLPTMSDDEARAMRKKLAAHAKAKPRKAKTSFTVNSERAAIAVYTSAAINTARFARRIAVADRYLAETGNREAAAVAVETMQRALANIAAQLAAKPADTPKQ